VIALFATVVLLVGNGLFVGAEFALIAARRTAIEPMAETSRAARLALRAMNEIPLMIAGAQLGITVCSLGLGAIAEPALAHLLEGPFHAVGVPDAMLHPIAFILALGVVVYLHTTIGEMVPKNLTLAVPDRAVLWLGPILYGFCVVTKPLLVGLRWLSRTILRIWRIEATDAVKTVFTAEELAGLVSQARTEGLLDAEEHARITGALALNNLTARDTLRSWATVTTVPEDISPASLELLATRTGRSRFPVVDRASRRVLGFVHVKDVLGLDGPARREPIPPDLVRPLPVVAPDRTLAEVLLAMRRTRRHMMLVSNGRNPLGVVTLDDVLRAVVGTAAVPASESTVG
jgi:CBS domain containing-hemolysin-like protein